MLNIIKNEEGHPIGWEMVPTSDEEQKIVATVRDLQFFGLEDTYPSYNGLELLDQEKGKVLGNIKRISWVQNKYQK